MIREKIYIKPKTIEEAVAAAQANENFRYIAGGTDIMVNKFQGNENTDCLIDLTEIEELKKIENTSEYLNIGSLVSLHDLTNIPEIRKEFPVLQEAAKSVASPVIRKTATIGGNILCENRCIFYNQSEWWREAAGFCLKCDGTICIATGGKKKCFSKFVSDMAVALIALNAKIEISPYPTLHNENHAAISTKTRTRIIPLESIYTGDGITPKNLEKTGVVKSIHLPLNQQLTASYFKLRQRESIDFTSLTTCVSIDKNEKIKIVIGGVDPKPIIVCGKKSDNKNDLITQAVKRSRIVDNDFYSRKYRQDMVRVFLKKGLGVGVWG